MIYYAIYDTTTGQIYQTCVAPSRDSISHLMGPNKNALEITDDLSNTQFYIDIDSNTLVEFPPKPNQYSVWDWTLHTWVDPRTLQDYKDEKWEQIKRDRDAAINAPLSTPYGEFDADSNSRANIANAVLYLQTLEQQGTPGTIDWTLADNTTITLNYAEMSSVGLLLGQRTNAAYDTGRALRAQIDAATTIAEVDAIHWPT